METPPSKEQTLSYLDNGIIENTSPPADFYHCDSGAFTPKNHKIRIPGTPFINRILHRRRTEAKKNHLPPEKEVPTAESCFYSEAEEYDMDVESSNSTADEQEEKLREVEEDDHQSEDSLDYAADVSGNGEEEPEQKKSPTTISTLLKSLVFVDVGPNISDTVHEFTNLLSDVATRKKHAAVICPAVDKE